MDQSKLMTLAIGGAIVFAAYKWGSGPVKAGALAVAAGIVANQIPYVRDAQSVRVI